MKNSDKSVGHGTNVFESTAGKHVVMCCYNNVTCIVRLISVLMGIDMGFIGLDLDNKHLEVGPPSFGTPK